jgi:hypothetical protein
MIDINLLLEKVKEYYLADSAKLGEAVLQMLFENLKFLDDEREVCVRVYFLDRFYSTQLTLHSAHLNMIQSIYKNRNKVKGLKTQSLFEGGDVESISALYHIILEDGRGADKSRSQQWSFVSKFLHFCYPNQYPIFDNTVNNYIEKAIERYPQISPQNSVRWSTPVYSDFCKEYIKVWDEFSESQKVRLCEGLEGVASEVGLDEITPLTALDKYFWYHLVRLIT